MFVMRYELDISVSVNPVEVHLRLTFYINFL